MLAVSTYSSAVGLQCFTLGWKRGVLYIGAIFSAATGA